MAPNDEKSTASDDHVNEDGDVASASLADQALLKALQDFIVPLIVRTGGRKRTGDNTHMPSGPEAGKLIAALQEFISSIVASSHSGSVGQNMIEVSLVEEEDEVRSDPDDDDDDDDDDEDEEDDGSASEGGSLPEKSNQESDAGDASSDNESEDQDILEKPQPSFHEKLLTALREHVFNTMPIRLLSFESQGSKLQVTLVERGVIHARLASALQENLHDPDNAPILGLETEEEAIKRVISKHARYAILSHTWLRTEPGEVTYGDWNKRKFNENHQGYQKLVNFCKTAWKVHELAFGWMDTICINKESSAELDESIRSMYNWYNRAHVCIIYLSETRTMSNIYADTWLTRGWTLQELLAPDVIKFYNADWQEFAENSFNDRMNTQIMKQIKKATTILEDELDDIHQSSISRRMQLAANRQVTREEDMAYSLMGIFNVSISTAYGEGAERSFFRLLQEILFSYEDVLDIFNWAGHPDHETIPPSDLLPPSPQYYLRRSSNKNLLLAAPMEPLTLTHLGLRLMVILMPAISISGKHTQHGSIGDYNAAVDIAPVGLYFNIGPTSTYNVLDKRTSGPDGPRKDNDYQITLAVFNFDGNEHNIYIRKTCAAFGLRCYEPAGQVTDFGYIDTIFANTLIAFELGKVDTHDEDNSDDDNANDDEGSDDDNVDSYRISTWNKETYYRLQRSELPKHGMQLLSLRL